MVGRESKAIGICLLLCLSNDKSFIEINKVHLPVYILVSVSVCVLYKFTCPFTHIPHVPLNILTIF